MKGRRYCDATDIIKNATVELKRAFTKWLPRVFPTLLQRWRNCMFPQGDCFEENVA
jgi:hypothetical protein